MDWVDGRPPAPSVWVPKPAESAMAWPPLLEEHRCLQAMLAPPGGRAPPGLRVLRVLAERNQRDPEPAL
jgi:hypothetical protein